MDANIGNKMSSDNIIRRNLIKPNQSELNWIRNQNEIIWEDGKHSNVKNSNI